MNKIFFKFLSRIKLFFFLFLKLLLGKSNYLKLLSIFKVGYMFNLSNPVSYNEKINFRKLYNKNYLLDLCSNKLFVRTFVELKIGKKYLIPLLFFTKKISHTELLHYSRPFIIKLTNSSGKNSNFIVNSALKQSKLKMILNKFNFYLKKDYGWISDETWYRNTKQYIIAEKLLDVDTPEFKEFKVYCFWNGNSFNAIIRVINNRFISKSSSFYDLNWNPLNITYNENIQSKHENKPLIFKQLIKLSKKLSREFDHVRVDFIFSNGKLFFGELTFADTSGFIKFNSKKTDIEFGKLWKLNNKMYKNSYKL